MKIRFNETAAPCVFESLDGEIRASFKSIDHDDVMAWSRRFGFRIPEHCWGPYQVVNGRRVREIDFSSFSVEETREWNMDNYRMAAYFLVSLEGVTLTNEDDPGKVPPNVCDPSVTCETKADILKLIQHGNPEFEAWIQQWILGSKKKSGLVELVE